MELKQCFVGRCNKLGAVKIAVFFYDGGEPREWVLCPEHGEPIALPWLWSRAPRDN